MQEKLINLGIDVWKKRSDMTSPLLEKEIFSIDKDIILLLGEKDKVLPKKDKEYFFRTLTKSIGRQDFKQLNKLSQSKEVTLTSRSVFPNFLYSTLLSFQNCYNYTL